MNTALQQDHPRSGSLKQWRRSEIAAYLANVAREVELDQVYAGGFDLPDDKRNYYSILLCRAKSVDGSIRVYGPTNITISYTTAIRHLPQRETVRLRDVKQAEEYLRSRFGEDADRG